MTDHAAYETVIGLEVHVQLQTRSKLFCGDSTLYGSPPNTQVSPVSLGHPGTLPKMNRKAIEYAVKMGLSCGCEIMKENYFARKNYFYPDLPKGYQVSQYTTPVCRSGSITISVDGKEKKISLNRIHLEEDAGKSIHDTNDLNTCMDYNRAGTALIEIVSEPELRSGEEAYAYLSAIRNRVRYLEICDGNMEEGSLRCDANISVRKKGETKLGIKTEIKNLNSIRNVKNAIEVESTRLISILEQGGTILQQTRSFDAATGNSFVIRDKEEADDYRYFPEPDLAPFHLEDDFIEQVRQSIPVLQEERVVLYTRVHGLPAYDASVLTNEKELAEYFEKVIAARGPGKPGNPKAAANWMLGPVKTWLNEHGNGISDFPLSPRCIAAMILLVEEGKISFSTAAGALFPLLLTEPTADPAEMAIKHNLLQQSDASDIAPIVDIVLEKFPAKVAEYKNGKKGLLAFFVGEVMKRSKGKADPKRTNELVLEKLKS